MKQEETEEKVKKLKKEQDFKIAVIGALVGTLVLLMGFIIFKQHGEIISDMVILAYILLGFYILSRIKGSMQKKIESTLDEDKL